MGTKKIKQAIKWGGSVVALLALFYFGLKFRDQMSEAMPLILERRNIIWVLLGVFAVAPQMACAAFAWRHILNGIGVRMSRCHAVRVIFLSQFARYLPGNVGHHMGKLVLAKEMGVGFKVCALSIFIETVVVLLVGLAISALFLPSQLFEYLARWNWSVAISLGGVVLVGACIYVLRRGDFRARWSQLKDELFQDVSHRVSLLLQTIVYYVINFLFIGGLAWVLATQVFGAYELSFLELTAIFSFCWTVGFLAPGAPAGLGVREVIAFALLRGSYSPEVATGLVLIHRVVLTGGDLVAFLIGLLMELKDRKRREPSVGSDEA